LAQAEPTGKDFSRVKPIPRSSPADPAAVRSLVAGFAACRVPIDELPHLRQLPGLLPGEPLPASFLKHADEQTVAAMVAVSRAIQEHGLERHDFSAWGIIAAPRFLGRAALAVALARFAAEGAWGISPHLIPHRSLHALSGTISQALKIHGPNYGVGGGADGAAEALLVANAMLSEQNLPGVWVVLTGFDPELVPADPEDVAPPQATECLAVALALVEPGLRRHGRFLAVGANGTSEAETDRWPLLSLENLAAVLAQGHDGKAARWQLRCGGWAVWEHAEAAVEISP
jgi:hypothetical protein